MSKHRLIPIGVLAWTLAACPAVGQAVVSGQAAEPAPGPGGMPPASDLPESTPLPAAFDPVSLGLEPAPLSVLSLGLEIHLPLGSGVQVQQVNRRTNISIQEGSEPPAWSMLVESARAETLDLANPEAQIGEHLKRLQKLGLPYQLISNEPVTYRGVTGHLCLLQQSAVSGREVVTGWLVMPQGQRSLVVFSIVTRPEDLPQVRQQLNASFETIGIVSEERIAAGREQGLLAGQALLATLTEEELRRCLGIQRLLRIYKPAEQAGSQDQEIGYSMIEVTEGKKGELNPQRTESSYDPSEHQAGLLVKVQGRVVLDAEHGTYYDSMGLYWMAWDQQAEEWSVRATVRRDDSERSDSETGLRTRPTTGDPAPTLTVIRATARAMARQPHQWSVPVVYLSQALVWIIDAVQLHDRPTEGRSVAWYSYSGMGASPSIMLRLDTLSAMPGGGWEIATRFGSDGPATVSRYDQRARLITRVRPDGTVSASITAAQLRDRWRSQGLSTGGKER